MRSRFLVVLLCIFGLVLSVSRNATADFTLTSSGQTSYVIAVPDDATPAEQTAAGELHTYLLQSTGAHLPIYSVSSVAASTPQILVGPSPRAQGLVPSVNFAAMKSDSDTIVIQAVGNNLVLAGSRPRGTLYAVYEFLEKTVGVRWFTATESIVPSKPALQVLTANNTVYTPPFFYREQYAVALQNNPLFATRMRQNGHYLTQDEWLGSHHAIAGFVHTFDLFMPPSVYFSTNPEWYSDVNNGNKPCTAASAMPTPQGSQLNLTNPAMRLQLIQNLREHMRRNPGAGTISVSQNDNQNYCQSPGDLAMIASQGSPSGPLIDMVNQVADALKAEFPNLLIETLAYQHTRKPPLTLKPRANMVIRLCSIEADFAHTLSNNTWNPDFRSNMEGWKAISPRLYVWDYSTNFNALVWPHPNLRMLAPNLRYFASSKVVSVFNQGDPTTNGGGDFIQLRLWLQSKLMWNPQLNDSTLINEFLNTYYGAAGPHLRKYLDGIQTAFTTTGRKLSTYEGDHSWLKLSVVDASWGHFKAAQTAVQGNAILSARVRRERLALDNVIITRFDQLQSEKLALGSAYNVATSALPADISTFTADFIAQARANNVGWATERDTIEATIANMQSRFPTIGSLPVELRASLADAVKQGRVYNKEESAFRFSDRPRLSDIVNDPLAWDGKSGAIVGSAGWEMQLDFPSAATWRVYVMARIQTNPGSSMTGSAFTAGVYDNGIGMLAQTYVNLDGSMADGGYHVVDLGSTYVGPTGFVFASPRQRSDVPYVNVDRAILVRQ